LGLAHPVILSAHMVGHDQSNSPTWGLFGLLHLLLGNRIKILKGKPTFVLDYDD
jgi:hypothetical protein